jgi:hypothetical protein
MDMTTLKYATDRSIRKELRIGQRVFEVGLGPFKFVPELVDAAVQEKGWRLVMIRDEHTITEM